MTSRQQGTTTRVTGAARSTRNELSARQGSKRSQKTRSQQMTIGDQPGDDSRYQQTRMSKKGSQAASRRTGRETSRQTAGTAKSNNLVQSRLSNQIVFRHTPSQANSESRSYASQYDDEEYDEDEDGDEREYGNEAEEEENIEEDEESVYHEDFYPEYAPTVGPGAKKVSGPRVELMDGPEPCHCFPKKSNKNIPSMVYEKIKCKHDGVQGEAHAGVYRFDFNWNEFMEEPKRRKRSQAPPKTNFVKGYPNPEFLGGEYVEEEEEADENEDDDDDTNQQEEDDDDDDDDDDDYTYHGDEEFDGRWGRGSDEEDDYDDEEEEVDEEELERQRALEEAIAKPSGIRAIIPLPQIGYSPPPSRERSTPMSQRSVPYSLPPLPESPFMSAQGRQTASSYAGSSRNSHKDRFRLKKKIDTVRRFQGRMYDPASKKVVSYDITPAFRSNMNSWNAHIDSGSSKASGSRISLQSGNRQSTLPSRRSVKVESRQTNILEEDDEDEDEYDEDEDDEDDEEDEDDYR